MPLDGAFCIKKMANNKPYFLHAIDHLFCLQQMFPFMFSCLGILA